MEQSDFDSITTRFVRHLREIIAQLQKNYDQLALNAKVSGNVQHANLDIVQTSINGVRYAQHLLWQALERPLLKSGLPSVTQKEGVQQAEPQQVCQVPEPGKVDFAYTSHSSKEKVHQGEPLQGFQVIGSGEAISTHTSSSSNLEETEHQASKPDVSGQLSTSGVKEGEISLRPQKGPKRVDTNVAGVKSCWFFNNKWENLLKGVEFDATYFITDVSGKYPRLWALKGAHPVTFNRWYNFRALTSIRIIAPGF
ncbi:hypothetical protein ACS0TY_016615 [Phlomoides rotata]